MPRAECEGAQVAYRTEGAGFPLVLVHGTGGNSQTNWGAAVERFSREWRVIAPDYSGSGATTDDGRQLTTDYLAAQIVAVADAAGAKRFHLLGFSLGAALAMKIAGDHPERVSALVLLAGFQSSRDARMRLEFELWRDLIATDRKALVRLLLLTGFSPDWLSALGVDGVAQVMEDALATTNWEGMARQVELNLALDVSDSIACIVAPTLVIGCTHDHMVPPSHARALAEAIPNARYAELPTGHLAALEQPEALVELVQSFLRE